MFSLTLFANKMEEEFKTSSSAAGTEACPVLSRVITACNHVQALYLHEPSDAATFWLPLTKNQACLVSTSNWKCDLIHSETVSKKWSPAVE